MSARDVNATMISGAGMGESQGRPEGDELSLGQMSMLEALGPVVCAHSARYVKARNPRLYALILLCLEYGIPKIEIARRVKDEAGVGVSQNLVRAIEENETASLDEGKRRLTSVVRRFVHAAWCRLAEEVDSMKLGELMIAAGIGTEKLLLLEGQATQIVAHTGGPSVHEVLQAIEARKRELERESAIEAVVTSTTGALVTEGEALEPVRMGASGEQRGDGGLVGVEASSPLGDRVEQTACLVVDKHPQ